ncbi:hypothetical protein RD792_007994 [Penstemon davidsonii]|uniref:Fungal lipase-type domain-containing protein n=1 Tax=Penstemon davidsonii TaxID=160366 RepID=A0ABR0D8M0_9LAMI|nr:hypothetical protein RD792_007993 [Penstemon davidsonii]KAK4485355.1 hypothetical protein RD792_007994 [Penstemon davidsonii]
MPPRYVIAFRGTITKHGNRAQDLKLDLHCIINNLRDSRRFKIGFELTQNLISQVGQGNVWLAGHSLGSSIALLIGRHMVQYTGTYLETYLFNPPFISAPIEMIKNENVKFGLRIAKSVVKAGLAKAAEKYGGGQSIAQEYNDPFIVLSSWTPYLFINPGDLICSEYFGYFEHREKMEKIGAGKIEKLATKHSIGNFVSSAMGIESEATHLIPSAYLSTNCSSSDEVHGINQWWKLDLEFKYKLYQYK